METPKMEGLYYPVGRKKVQGCSGKGFAAVAWSTAQAEQEEPARVIGTQGLSRTVASEGCYGSPCCLLQPLLLFPTWGASRMLGFSSVFLPGPSHST